MALTLLRHATQKPPIGPLKLDYGNPLASGMLSAYIGNEYGSSALWDPVQQRPITRFANGLGSTCGTFWVNSGSNTNVGSPWGPAILHDASGTGTFNSEQLNMGVLAMPSTFTAVVAIRLPSGFGTSSLIFGSNGSPNFELRTGTGGILTLLNSGSHAFTSSTGTITAATWTVVGVSRDSSNNVQYWLNGANAGGGGVDSTAITWTNQVWVCGANPVGDTTPIGTLTAWAYFWNRGLIAAEHAQVYAEPFAMWQTRPIQKWPVISGSAFDPTTLGNSFGITDAGQLSNFLTIGGY